MANTTACLETESLLDELDMAWGRAETDLLNENISKFGRFFGPSLVTLLLDGPLPDGTISVENIDILLDQRSLIERIYQERIASRIGELIRYITFNQARFPGYDNDSKYCLRVRRWETVREKLRQSYDRYRKKPFSLDAITDNALHTRRPLERNEIVDIGFDNNNYIFLSRIKTPPSRKKKLLCEYQQLSAKDREEFPDFLITITGDSTAFWSEEGQETYIGLFGKDLCEKMMIDDCFALSIYDLDFKRGSQTIVRLQRRGCSLNIPGFNVVPRRFKDRMGREQHMRPGGIHHVMIDYEFRNFPIEVKLLNLSSSIFHHLGPHNHNRYVSNGKKSNEFYRD